MKARCYKLLKDLLDNMDDFSIKGGKIFCNYNHEIRSKEENKTTKQQLQPTPPDCLVKSRKLDGERAEG